ncbi:MAG: lipoyl(octanoyl) transferase LipB [Candidatus Nucleicultricaceae bacterium]
MQNLEQTARIEWVESTGFVPYEHAMEEMSFHVDAIQRGIQPERIWLLEHDHVFTKGTSGDDREALDIGDVPLITTHRGGRITYHGPGQRVGYLMLDLRTREKDVRLYVQTVEAWLIETLRHFSLDAFTRPDRIGLWVNTPNGGEAKIAAIGIRLQKWVSSHGFALNVHPDLQYFKRIVPCGLGDYGVTSLHNLGVAATLKDVDAVLQKTFLEFF